jgi:hypothetical protein
VAVRNRTSRYGEALTVLQMVEKEREALSPYAFEDAYFLDVEQGDALRPYRLRRAFAVPPGEYELYFVARETGAQGTRTGVLARPLLVPDLTGQDLQLSSLVVAERVDPVPEGLARKNQGRRPYAIGSVDIVPAASPSFDAYDRPVLAFQVYNAALDGGKPNVSVEYRVLKRTPEGEDLPIARLETQQFDASTLPRDFDPRLGHELGVLAELPVSSLAPGAYRLEVTVTDTLALQSLTRKVEFEVRPGPALR